MIKAKDIHVIQKDGRYVVFHPESLSLFFVTECIGNILKLYETNSNNIDSGVGGFIDDILSHLSDNIEFDLAKDLKWANSKPRTLNLLVSQDCNLKCGYCYADHGTYRSEKMLMNYDTAKKCIDKLLSEDYDNTIVFFGGEPLLNFHLIKEIYFHLSITNLNVRYIAITNGTIMNDEIKNFINDHFLNLWISLDGPRDLNDGQRSGSFKSVHDHVVETIDELHPRSYPLIIKSIITKKSANQLTEIVEHISALNIDFMDIKPVKDVPPESEFFMSDDDYKLYLNNLSHILTNSIKRLANGENVKLISYIAPILTQMITKTKMINRCAAGRELMTITADGDVYPCEKYVGLEEFHMGNVHEDDFPGEKFNSIREMFYKINVYNSLDCNSCWARFFCGGECHFQSYITHGDLSRTTERRCLEMKSILEALLPEIAEIFSDEIKTKNVLNYLKLYKQNRILNEMSH
jgi:uncharacterized protein